MYAPSGNASLPLSRCGDDKGRLQKCWRCRSTIRVFKVLLDSTGLGNSGNRSGAPTDEHNALVMAPLKIDPDAR
jgi:hypothetical protein